MKVGDLVRFKNPGGEVFLIMRTQVAGPYGQKLKVWICPDPDEGFDHTDEDNYYYDHYFEVVSESRRSGKDRNLGWPSP